MRPALGRGEPPAQDRRLDDVDPKKKVGQFSEA